MRCIRKPIVHEYFPVHEILYGESKDFPEWVLDGFGVKEQLHITAVGPRRLFVYTLEGKLAAPDDGYIIRGVHGEVWPIKKEAFEATYEVIKEEEEEMSKIIKDSIPIQIALVKKSLEDMSAEYVAEPTEIPRTDMVDGVVHLLSAVRHYCEFHKIHYKACDMIANSVFGKEAQIEKASD